MAAGAGLVAWLSANGFSTLWIEWRLWIVPCMAYASLVWLLWQIWKALLRPTIFTGGLVVATTTGLYATGAILSRHEALAISPSAKAVVIASRTEAASEWHVWVDPTVLGEFYGKELRRCVLKSGVPLGLVVHPPFDKTGATLPDSAAGVILFGKQTARAQFYLSAAREVLLIHPTTPPPDGGERLPRRVTVIFPEIDEAGNRQAWERWAASYGARFVVSGGSGLDIRSVWPEIVGEVTGRLR